MPLASKPGAPRPKNVIADTGGNLPRGCLIIEVPTSGVSYDTYEDIRAPARSFNMKRGRTAW